MSWPDFEPQITISRMGDKNFSILVTGLGGFTSDIEYLFLGTDAGLAEVLRKIADEISLLRRY